MRARGQRRLFVHFGREPREAALLITTAASKRGNQVCACGAPTSLHASQHNFYRWCGHADQSGVQQLTLKRPADSCPPSPPTPPPPSLPFAIRRGFQHADICQTVIAMTEVLVQSTQFAHMAQIARIVGRVLCRLRPLHHGFRLHLLRHLPLRQFRHLNHRLRHAAHSMRI